MEVREGTSTQIKRGLENLSMSYKWKSISGPHLSCVKLNCLVIILFFEPIMTILTIEHSPDPILQLQNLNYSTASILICMPLELRSANLHLEIVSSEKPLTGVWIGVGTLLENLLFPQLQSTSRWGNNECQLTGMYI